MTRTSHARDALLATEPNDAFCARALNIVRDLLPSASESAIATALRSMLASPALLEQLRNNALESVAGRRWDATFDHLEREYAEVVGRVGNERRAKAGMGA
jgi:hypothetical protein